MNPKDFLKNCKIIVSNETYAIVKAKKTDPQAFANIVDKNEITVIIDQSRMDPDNIIKVEHDWKLLTFDIILPFELIGFFSLIAQALAEAKISIFAISAFSTDHLLVKSKDLNKSCETLAKIGCRIT